MVAATYTDGVQILRRQIAYNLVYVPLSLPPGKKKKKKEKETVEHVVFRFVKTGKYQFVDTNQNGTHTHTHTCEYTTYRNVSRCQWDASSTQDRQKGSLFRTCIVFQLQSYACCLE